MRHWIVWVGWLVFLLLLVVGVFGALYTFLGLRAQVETYLYTWSLPREHRVATSYTGDYRWLCKYHYEAWQPNIPDVILHN